MFRINTIARTVDVHELKVENKMGADGKTYESKSITFKVATNRNYTISKTVNGVITKERPTDFMFCKAIGSLAQAIADHASERKADGKIVSRRIELVGHLETYTSLKKTVIEQLVPIGDKKYNIKFNAEIPVDQTIFIVKELDFLDSATKAPVGGTIPAKDTSFQVTEVAEGTEVASSISSNGTANTIVNTESQVATNNIVQDIQAPDLTQTINTEYTAPSGTQEITLDDQGVPNPNAEGGTCPF